MFTADKSRIYSFDANIQGLFEKTDFLGGNTKPQVNWDFYCFEQ